MKTSPVPACDELTGLADDLKIDGLTVAFARVDVQVMKLLRAAGTIDAVGDEYVYPLVSVGVADYLHKSERHDEYDELARDVTSRLRELIDRAPTMLTVCEPTRTDCTRSAACVQHSSCEVDAGERHAWSDHRRCRSTSRRPRLHRRTPSADR